MDKVIQSIIRTMPKNVKGLYVVKNTEIFIPYKEVGVECLTKEVTEINLFFESILKFIEIGVDDIIEISHILGVNYNIIKEVIVDMIEQKYLVTTQNRIIMTPKGRMALETRKSVTIQKRFINQLLVNLITGEIISGDGIITTKVEKNDICLNEEQKVNKEYLENHHSIINDIFQKYQMEDNAFGIQSITRELYKILDIAYERLVYVKNQLYIYKSPDAEEYQFAFDKDINEQYINCFYRQVKAPVPPCLENFFERDFSFAKSHKNKILMDEKLLERTMTLSKTIGQHSDQIDERLIMQFQSKRYIVTDNEYKNYFVYNNDFLWDKLIIMSGRLKKILDRSIWNELKNISNNKEIYIIYDQKERGIENELIKLKEKSIKNQNIFLIRKNELQQNIICFYPSVAIEVFEEVYEMFQGAVTLKKGIVEFEQKNIQELTEKIRKDYDIIFQDKRKVEEGKVEKNKSNFGKKDNRNQKRKDSSTNGKL